MKILQITPTFIPSKFGGIKTVSYQISRSLANRGHSVTVFTTDAEIGNERLVIDNYHTNIENIEIRYFRNLNNTMAYRFRLFLPLDFFTAVKKDIKKYDIIHIHDYRSILAIITCHHAKKNGIPYIIQAHGSILPFFDKQLLKKLFDVIWGNQLLKNASKLIASTECEKNQYKRMGIPDEKITIIPNGIDLTLFSSLPPEGMFKLKNGNAKEEKIVLFLGRVHKIKGVDLLIEAFSNINKKIPHVTLVIAGPDDGYTKELQEKVEQLNIGNKVLFTGTLSIQDKLSAFIDANVYVLPSIFECFPITVLEAWALRTSNRC